MILTRSKNYDLINEGCDDQMKICGFKRSKFREIICVVFYFFTLGILKVLFDWYPILMVRLRCNISSLEKADFVELVDQCKQTFVARISTLNNATEQKYFLNKKVKYVWNRIDKLFEKLKGPHYGKKCSYFHQCQGLSLSEKDKRREIFGKNSVSIHVTPILKLLYTQGLNPFYVFQALSCTLWFMDQYYYFAACIIILSFLSLAAQIHQMRHSERKLKETVGKTEKVSVYRSDTGEYEMTEAEYLVPGDMIEIPKSGCNMQCDAVLICGVCIVNESMLTGESIPITKVSVPDDDDSFSDKEHSRHVLYCGTKVIQTRFYEDQKVTAIVTHTGFMTTKGELVRSILFPKPVNFKFTQDSYKFLACLAMVAATGMIYTIILMVTREETLKRVIVRTLDLVTIVIPPALPAAMTVGVVMAQKRLWNWMIYCINSNNINLCGAVNCFCFDKTGTLTEDGLDFRGVVPIVNGWFKPEVKDVKRLGPKDKVVISMATCHSLTMIEDEIVGDPVDLKMFEATDWVIDESGSKFDTFVPTIVKPRNDRATRIHDVDDEEEADDFGIIRQFTFSSRLQRMSVVVRRLHAPHYELFLKGSPEMVASLSNPETVPANFQEVLSSYTRKGYRVLALAHRDLKMGIVKVQRCHRDQAEKKLTMLGLIVFENQLKPETKPIINVLNNANIRSIMVTGDNLLTALSVAKNCDIIGQQDKITFLTSLPSVPSEGRNVERKFELHWAKVDDGESDDDYADKSSDHCKVSFKDDIIEMSNHNETKKLHLAVTGKSWSLIRRHHPHILTKMLEHGTVFARFSPDQKQQLIESLIEEGNFVGMCGDGANDCGALKAAHAGISLSEAEASVASPFTSKQANISCVPNLIKEGRAALVTSFGIFKFMASYSLTQFTSVCLLYWVGANLSDLQFLYIDLVLLAFLSFTFSRTHAFPHLTPHPPRVSLLAISPILSILMHMLINLSFQLTVWFLTNNQPWFEPYFAPPPQIRNFTCHEVTAVFSISAFQYITLAIVFSKGSPYRKSIFTNYLFLLTILMTTLLNILIVVSPVPVQWFFNIFQLKPAPEMIFRFLLVTLAILNFILSFVVEMFLIDMWLDGGCSNNCVVKQANNSQITHPTNENNCLPPEPSDQESSTNDIKAIPCIENGECEMPPESLRNFQVGYIEHINIQCSSSNSLFNWLPQHNEHKSLAELMEMEQASWEKIEASMLNVLPESDQNVLDFSDDEERPQSRRSSASISLISTKKKRDSQDAFVIEMNV